MIVKLYPALTTIASFVLSDLKMLAVDHSCQECRIQVSHLYEHYKTVLQRNDFFIKITFCSSKAGIVDDELQLPLDIKPEISDIGDSTSGQNRSLIRKSVSQVINKKVEEMVRSCEVEARVKSSSKCKKKYYSKKAEMSAEQFCEANSHLLKIENMLTAVEKYSSGHEKLLRIGHNIDLCLQKNNHVLKSFTPLTFGKFGRSDKDKRSARNAIISLSKEPQDPKKTANIIVYGTSANMINDGGKESHLKIVYPQSKMKLAPRNTTQETAENLARPTLALECSGNNSGVDTDSAPEGPDDAKRCRIDGSEVRVTMPDMTTSESGQLKPVLYDRAFVVTLKRKVPEGSIMLKDGTIRVEHGGRDPRVLAALALPDPDPEPVQPHEYVCNFPECSKIFSNFTSMRNHRIEKHRLRNGRWKCHKCAYHCKDMVSIKHHFQKCHESVIRHCCDKCGFLMKSDNELKAHLKKHEYEQTNGEKLITSKHKCHLCNNFRFTRRHQIREHLQQVHDCESTHTCPTCGKMFEHLHYLQNHERSHNPEKQFQCQHCSYSSRFSNNLYTHTKQKHPEVHRLLQSGNFKCPFCEFKGDRFDKLKRHMHVHDDSRIILEDVRPSQDSVT